MTITIELSKQQEERLAQMAARKGIPIDKLAMAALEDALSHSEAEFDVILDRVMARNDELYRRLS